LTEHYQKCPQLLADGDENSEISLFWLTIACTIVAFLLITRQGQATASSGDLPASGSKNLEISFLIPPLIAILNATFYAFFIPKLHIYFCN
jgi:hypothetical protein